MRLTFGWELGVHNVYRVRDSRREEIGVREKNNSLTKLALV